MLNSYLKTTSYKADQLSIIFYGEFDLYMISDYDKQIHNIKLEDVKTVNFDFTNLEFLDTAASIYLKNLQNSIKKQDIKIDIICQDKTILETLAIVDTQQPTEFVKVNDEIFLTSFGKKIYENYLGFKSFVEFFGQIFLATFHYMLDLKNIRYKEIFFSLNEVAIKAVWIISLTSFLIGLVVAYQSAYQLKIYGANIFVVDMLGISILRELSPLITAIVIAGRSGSAFTAEIGAMKITQELDAMKTMGFDPYRFLVLPRIIALIIAMPIMVFLSDMMAVLGGMIIANVDLGITTELFLDRFSDVVAIKHFYIGMIKAPFFAFLIATIAIYRGMIVRDDTQSIGINTTKSVVESIFAVIICDAIFSIAFTNLGI